MLLDCGPKDGAEANPSMWASSTEEMKMDQCGAEGTMGNSQMPFSPGCLARSWAHDQPQGPAAYWGKEGERQAPPPCQAAGKVRGIEGRFHV